MRLRSWLLAALLFVTILPTVASAQHVADRAALQDAVSAGRAADDANRAVVLKALEHRDVREMAATLGVDLKDAASAVQVLSGDELAALAEPAKAIAADQAGGATTVVISVTTLLLLLILIVLIVD